MCRQFDSGPRHRMTRMTTRLAAIRVGAGLSTRKSGLAATQYALDAALGPLEGAIPDLAFLFVAPQFEDELESILQSANASLGGGTLLGCVAGGVIGGAREVEDAPAVSAWAATLPGGRVRPFTLTYAEEEEHGVFDGLEGVPTRAPHSALGMLAGPYTSRAQRRLRARRTAGAQTRRGPLHDGDGARSALDAARPARRSGHDRAQARARSRRLRDPQPRRGRPRHGRDRDQRHGRSGADR